MLTFSRNHLPSWVVVWEKTVIQGSILCKSTTSGKVLGFWKGPISGYFPSSPSMQDINLHLLKTQFPCRMLPLPLKIWKLLHMMTISLGWGSCPPPLSVPEHKHRTHRVLVNWLKTKVYPLKFIVRTNHFLFWEVSQKLLESINRIHQNHSLEIKLTLKKYNISVSSCFWLVCSLLAVFQN